MKALSSAAITRSLEIDHLGNPSSKAYLLTEPVFTEPESLLEFERLNTEGSLDSKSGQPTTPTQADETSLIDQGSANFQWKVFGSTFITIFLAELGDKTQVATLLMSAESHAPWVVFTGAAAALMATSLLGVLVGQWLSARVSPKTLDRAAGVMLAFISLWLFLDAVKL